MTRRSASRRRSSTSATTPGGCCGSPGSTSRRTRRVACSTTSTPTGCSVGLADRVDEEVVAHRWVAERVRARHRASCLPSCAASSSRREMFHEVLEHRWFMGERLAATSRSDRGRRRLRRRGAASTKPDEKAVLGQRLGTPSNTTGVRFEDTAEMDLSELSSRSLRRDRTDLRRTRARPDSRRPGGRPPPAACGASCSRCSSSSRSPRPCRCSSGCSAPGRRGRRCCSGSASWSGRRCSDWVAINDSIDTLQRARAWGCCSSSPATSSSASRSRGARAGWPSAGWLVVLRAGALTVWALLDGAGIDRRLPRHRDRLTSTALGHAAPGAARPRPCSRRRSATSSWAPGRSASSGPSSRSRCCWAPVGHP